MKKKIIIIILILLIIVILGLFFFSGSLLKHEGPIILVDYSLSENETKVKLKVHAMLSFASVGRAQVKHDGDNEFVTFYNALFFKIGEKDDYEIELNSTSKKIYFYIGDGQYKLVLIKNEETNQWEKPDESKNDLINISAD